MVTGRMGRVTIKTEPLGGNREEGEEERGRKLLKDTQIKGASVTEWQTKDRDRVGVGDVGMAERWKPVSREEICKGAMCGQRMHRLLIPEKNAVCGHPVEVHQLFRLHGRKVTHSSVHTHPPCSPGSFFIEMLQLVTGPHMSFWYLHLKTQTRTYAPTPWPPPSSLQEPCLPWDSTHRVLLGAGALALLSTEPLGLLIPSLSPFWVPSLCCYQHNSPMVGWTSILTPMTCDFF